MVKYKIYVHIDKKHGLFGVANTPIKIRVSKSEPFDSSSKIFNMYKHKIQYHESSYDSSKYYIEVCDPNARFYTYLLKYNQPKKQVKEIDVYFRSSDGGNKEPLILGFHQEKGKTLYYRAEYLYKYTTGIFTHTIQNFALPTNKFYEDDLLTRLIEELGIYETSRKDKLVIRLEKKTNSNSKYPDSGRFPKKITLSKQSNCEHFEKYNHTIDNSLREILFYLSFNNNSLYADGGLKYKKLDFVDVYYCKYNLSNPVLIIFKFSSNQKYLYKYSNFKDDLEKINFVKKIYELKEFQESDLLKELIDEYDKFNKKITVLVYKKKDGYSTSVKVTPGEEKSNTNYKIYTHTITQKTISNFNSSNILLKDLQFKTENKLYEEKVKQVSAYFLKNKSGKKEDDVPFLIEINPEKDGETKHYYSKNKDDDPEWKKVEITETLESKLEGLKQVEDENFSGGRTQAYETLDAKPSQALTQQLSQSQEDAKREDDSQTQDNEDTGTPSSEGNMYVIIGSVVGGLVFLGSIGGGGGYWWYKRSVRNRILL